MMKAVNEKITNNLTSYQYLTVLDELLYNAVAPIVGATRFFDVFLAQVLGWQTVNPKRKSCGVGRQELATLTTLFFLTEDPKQKMKIVRQMKLYRNILFECVYRWLEATEEYERISSVIGSREGLEATSRVSELGLMRPGWSLHSTRSATVYWVGESKKFKESIVQKYTRLCARIAQQDYVKLGHPISLDDMLQIYVMTMSKAIDRCDADRGVLTTHIQNWLKSAKNTVQSMGEKDSGGYSHKDKVFGHVSLEDVDVAVSDDDTRDRQEEIMRIRRVAKAFDPEGVGRILLGIEEVLSDEDRRVLHSMAVRPLGSASSGRAGV